MAQFTSDGLTLAYDEFGPADARKAIVLVHGFSSNKVENWKRMGWYDAIASKGLRGLALDCRGHGESAKPHDPALYARAAMVGDIVALLDRLGAARAELAAARELRAHAREHVADLRGGLRRDRLRPIHPLRESLEKYSLPARVRRCELEGAEAADRNRRRDGLPDE